MITDTAKPDVPETDEIRPRLLTTSQAGRYLGISKWTVMDYHAAGLLEAVDLPAIRPRPGDRAKSRLLFDKADLDRFIDSARRRTR